MGEAIRVEVARPVDGQELIHFFEERGLAGELVLAEDGWEVDVGYARKERARLEEEVWQAIGEWLAECDVPLVLTDVDHEGGRDYALRPPGE